MNFKPFTFFLSFAVYFFTIQVFGQTPSAPPLTIDQSPVSIRVDGHLEDWPSARMIVLNKPSQVVSGRSYWKTDEDFSGRIFITYDAQFLYVAAVVRKQGAIINDNEPLSLWNGDCLELFLSVNPKSKNSQRLTSEDYLLGFSPGSGCKNPQMYCFNKNKEILGGRVIARPAKTGYVLEACVPLSFFEGLEMGPGKKGVMNVVLDEGGPISGNRIVQMDMSEKTLSRENPGTWTEFQWIGHTEVSVPVEHMEDVNAQLVQDGTKGANYLGMGNLQGQVVDSTGKPLVRAHVTTWPKSEEVLTDKNGQFKIDRVKLYDKTLVYGRADGFATSLCPLPRRGTRALIRLSSLPRALSNSGGVFVWGQTLTLGVDGSLDKIITEKLDLLKPLKLGVLRLRGTESALKLADGGRQALDQFVALARQLGAEPMVEIPVGAVSTELPTDWVRYCNVEKKYNIRYWTIGDEPDLASIGLPEDYSAYDYVNDYRALYNLMKKVDPSIFILGPELAWKYTNGDNDWLSPMVAYNADILDVVSVHRYAALKSADLNLKDLQAGIRNDGPAVQNLTDKIAGISDHFISLSVTGLGLCRDIVQLPSIDKKVPTEFWNALWTVEKLGLASQENLGMVLLAGLPGTPGQGFLTDSGPKPAYWGLKLFSDFWGAKPVGAQIQQADMTVFANQDPKTKDVSLLILNKSDRYYRPKILLSGKDADLIVEGGIDQQVDYEIPSFSISLLKIKSNNSPGQMTVYTYKQAQEGKGPVTSVLKPW